MSAHSKASRLRRQFRRCCFWCEGVECARRDCPCHVHVWPAFLVFAAPFGAVVGIGLWAFLKVVTS